MTVNVFSIGDSNEINTWSSVPYFFTKALSDENIKINQINIQPCLILKRIYKYSIGFPLKAILKLFGIKYDFNFSRGVINNYLTNRKIKKKCEKFHNVNCNVFLTYSFSSVNYSKVPVIHLCDQLYEEVFINHKILPSRWDKKIIEQELNLLKKAQFIYSTNLNTIILLKEKYNILNSDELKYRLNLDTPNISLDFASLIMKKQESRNILFIGRLYYERGVDVLIDAFKIFNQRVNNSYKLHVVGTVLKKADIVQNSNILFYEFLDKSNSVDYAKYLELLSSSKIFVFPMRFGPIPAALFEANYFYCPGIITDIHNIENDIKNYENGILIDEPDHEKFANAMYELSQNEELWERLAINAHNYANKYTLKAMAQTIIDQIHKFEKN
jgi:glycosyltransferase involved in cell wall biosynthesis